MSLTKDTFCALCFLEEKLSHTTVLQKLVGDVKGIECLNIARVFTRSIRETGLRDAGCSFGEERRHEAFIVG
jgi:hypothetical protein